jgi:hypothetical protein
MKEIYYNIGMTFLGHQPKAKLQIKIIVQIVMTIRTKMKIIH